MDDDTNSGFRYIFGKIITSLNPVKYRQLKSESLRSSFLFLFQLLLIAYIMGMVIFAPIILNLPAKINTELEKINSIDLKINMKQNESIVIGNSKFVLGDELYYKKGICFLYDPLCNNEKGNMTYNSALEKERLEKKVRTLFVIALPFIIIGSFIFNYLRFLLFAIIAGILIHLLAKLIKKPLSVVESFNTALYSLIVLIIFEAIITPIGLSMGFIPILVYVVFLIINFVIVVRESEG